MPTSRHTLLHSRLVRVGGALNRLNRGEVTAVPGLLLALRRLRHVLPILQLEGDSVSRIDARLRKIAQRLRPVARVDAMLNAVEEVAAQDRQFRHGSARLKAELTQRRTKLSVGAVLRTSTIDLSKILMRLSNLADELIGTRESAAALRARTWAVKARVARRALDLKRALDGAGAVYLPGRLGAVRRATRRFRLGVDVLREVTQVVRDSDVKALEQLMDALDRLRESERLVEHLRELQGAVSPPDLKAWQELDDLTVAMEHRCRRFHGRYVRERQAVALVADRLGARAGTGAASKRKVS